MKMLVFIYSTLIAFFLWPDGLMWWKSQGDFARMTLHHFFHGNVFHLLANGLTLYFLVPKIKSWHLLVGYVLATLAFLSSNTYVIGFSNIIYAIIGLRTPSFKAYWWRHPGTITFFAVSLLMFLIPNVSAITHLVSFVGGVLVSIVLRQTKEMTNGSARYI